MICGSLALIVIMLCIMLSACGAFGGNKEEAAPTTYTIQYTDDEGSHTITVKDGDPYSLETVPTRDGYTFDGLFDAEVGGTKFVSASGASLAVFTEKKNMVLFAHFTPNQYTIALDFQGAEVVGSRQFTVGFGQPIPELPKGLTLEHSKFTGWYTEPNGQGLQIADQYGNKPVVSVLNNTNFDLSNELIYLYAGFEAETYTVTFYNDNGDSEEIKVGYNTPIKEVIPEFRKDGKAVISWSKVQNDTELTAVFMGKVTTDLVLYAAEWAPILEFDANGGKDVAAIIAKEGTGISLPTPQRTDYTFAGWYTKGGVEFTAKTMPAESQQLTAKWNAQLIFSTNGGTAVDNISEPVGTKITLPTTEKDSYIFAGWYTADGAQYADTSMPQDTVKLVAKYYKIEHVRKVLINDTTDYEVATSVPNKDKCLELDLSDIYKLGVREIKITANYLSQVMRDASEESPKYNYFNWYSQKTASDAYLLWKNTDKLTKNGVYLSFEHTEVLPLTSETIYICPYGYTYSGSYSWDWRSNYRKNFWVEVEYPDMTTLY